MGADYTQQNIMTSHTDIAEGITTNQPKPAIRGTHGTTEDNMMIFCIETRHKDHLIPIGMYSKSLRSFNAIVMQADGRAPPGNRFHSCLFRGMRHRQNSCSSCPSDFPRRHGTRPRAHAPPAVGGMVGSLGTAAAPNCA